MRYLAALMLISSLLLLTSCATGRSIGPIIQDEVRLYIGYEGDLPNRIDFVGEPLGQFEIQVAAGGYHNMSGFQFDFNFEHLVSGETLTYTMSEFGGAFSDFFCVPLENFNSLPYTSPINNVACASLADSNQNSFAYLYNFTFTPSAPGDVNFNILLDDSSILADDQATRVPFSQTAPNPDLTIKICVDEDNDGYFSTADCQGSAPDCNDNSIYYNPGVSEICNLVDNNCDGDNTLGADCSLVEPSINSVTANEGAGAQDMSSSLELTGTVDFDVIASDNSYFDTVEDFAGSDLTTARFYVDGNLIGSAQFSGTHALLENYNTASLSEGSHTLRVEVEDELGQTDFVEYSFTSRNQFACQISSITWNQATVNEGETISFTVNGNSECSQVVYDFTNGFRYQECDSGVCTDIANPQELLEGFSDSVDFNGASSVTVSGIANYWFEDDDSSVNSLEIRVAINDADGPVYSSNQLVVNNVAPEVSSSEVINYLSADITANADVPSRFTLSYGESAGSLTNNLSTSTSEISHTFELSGLLSSHQYFYQITAIDGENGLGLVSEGSISSFTTQTRSADFDGDGVVDFDDLTEVVFLFRQDASVGSGNENYDVNQDEIIDIFDITAVVLAYD